MRPIGQLETEEQAQTFADYLFIHEIEGQVEPDKRGGFSIWVVDEDRVEESRALLSRFRSMPDAEEFFQASQAADERRREAQRAAKQVQKKLRRPGALSWRLGGGGLTTVMLSVSIVVALLTQLGRSREWVAWLQISNGLLLDPARFWLSLTEIAQGQVWRLITPIFLHFSLLHLVFNLLLLRDLGGILEAKIGTARFALAVILIALVSNLSQYVAGGANFGGMSGVVYGVFGYLWMRNKMDFNFGVLISPMASGMLMVFLALGFFGLLGPTANAAHLSGLLAGAALGWLAALKQRG
jgi:GlpG protein